MPRSIETISADLRQLEKLPVILDFRRLGTSLRRFLAADLRFAQLMEQVLSEEWGLEFFGRPYEPVRTLVLEEVLRALQNFVTAARALVDHARRRTKSIQDPAFHERLKLETDRRFTKNGEVQFVHGLRNYGEHVDLPPVRLSLKRTRVGDGEMVERRLTLRREDFHAFEWSAAARKFLDSQKDPIELPLLRERYSKSVVDFHHWLARQWPEAIAAPLARQNALRHELRVALGAEHLAAIQSLVRLHRSGIGTEEDVLGHLLRPDLIAASRERGEPMLALIDVAESEYGTLPEAVRFDLTSLISALVVEDEQA